MRNPIPTKAAWEASISAPELLRTAAYRRATNGQLVLACAAIIRQYMGVWGPLYPEREKLMATLDAAEAWGQSPCSGLARALNVAATDARSVIREAVSAAFPRLSTLPLIQRDPYFDSAIDDWECVRFRTPFYANDSRTLELRAMLRQHDWFVTADAVHHLGVAAISWPNFHEGPGDSGWRNRGLYVEKLIGAIDTVAEKNPRGAANCVRECITMRWPPLPHTESQDVTKTPTGA